MKSIFSLLLTLLIVNAVFSQPNITPWTKKFPGNVKWYKITDLGNLVVCTGDALYGLDPVTGNESWKQEDLDGIREEYYEAIDGTPYAVLVRGAGIMKGVQHAVVDLSSGKILINTKEEFFDVKKRLEAISNNSIIFFGTGRKSGKMHLANYSLTDGSIIWSQDKLFEKNSEEIVSRAFVTGDGIYIATTKNIYKLNSATGEVIWSVDKKTEKPVVATRERKGIFGKGNAAVDVNGNATSTSCDFFQKEDKNIIYFWNQDEMDALNTADGKEAFKSIELQSPVGYIMFDTHGMLVTTTEKTQKDQAKENESGGGLLGKLKRSSAKGKNRASVLCIDPTNLNNKWGDEIDLQGDVTAYKLFGNKLVLATERDKGDNYISIIDLDAGKSITKKPLSINGEIRDLELVPQGLYYRTEDEINILDMESGKKTWKKGFKVKNCVGTNADDKTGYVYANDIIYKIDFTQGDINEWVKDVKMEGGEDASSMQIRDNGVLLVSQQNMNLYSTDGNLVWHSYQPSIGKTGFGKVLSGLGGLAAATLSAASAAQSAQLSYAKGYYGSTDPQLDRDIKTANSSAVAFGSAAASSFASIGKRFKASKQGNDFTAVLTKLGGNNQSNSAGMVIVSKLTGKVTAAMMVGDKTPDYQLDELGNMLFQKSDNDEMSGFKF